MPLHQKKRRRLPGMAEVIALLLTGGTVVPAALWWGSATTSSWDSAPGAITRAAVKQTHYNAEDTRKRVDCEYEFVVEQITYKGTWSGFWPEAHSPNALLRDELGVLQPGYSITVYYDAKDPRESDPHTPGSGRQIRYAWLFALSCLATGYYCFRIYPSLRAL